MSSPGGIEVNRISVRAVPDASHIFAELKADLEEIERRVMLEVRASVDAAELTASAREAVAQAQAAAGDIDVKANVDTSQLHQAESALRSAGSGATGLLGGFSALAAGAGILSTALIPLTAVLGGLVLALAAPLAVAAGGVTIFGFLAGFAAKDTLEQIKKINDLDSKLSGLKKGTQEYADTLSQLQAAQAGLTPAQASFAAALDKVKGAFANIPKGVLLKPLTDALGLLADLIPKLTPILSVVSGIFDDLVNQLDRVVNSKGFKGFVKAFSHDLGRDLRLLASIAGNVFIGLGGLFGALDDTLSKGVLKGLDDLTGKFADFGKKAKDNKGLKSFVDYVKQNLPKVGDLISNSFGVLGDALGELAPVGSAVLDFLNGILGAFQKLGEAAGPLAGALALGGIATFFGGPEVGASVAAVVALGEGLRRLWQRSRDFRDIIHDVGDYFKSTWLPKIQDAAQQILPALKDAFKDVTDTVRDNKGLFKVFGDALVAITSAAVIGAIGQLALGIRLIGKAFKFGTASVKIFADESLAIFQFIVAGVKVLVDAVLAQFGVIVDSATAAFGWIPGIGGKVKDAKNAFHDFTSAVDGNLDAVSGNLKDLQDQIDEVGKKHPRFTIDSNVLKQIAAMHELDALRLHDKHFKITAQIEQQIERVTAPGGGMQRPTGLNSGSGNGASGRSGAAVNIEKGFFTDTNDVLRKADARSRRRASGGVLFPAARVPNFAGA